MDKNEAERLARAIRMMQMDWIKVDGIVHNSTTGQYEVQCTYQREDQGQTLSREFWTTLKIKSPRKSDLDTDTIWWRPGTSPVQVQTRPCAKKEQRLDCDYED